MWNSLAVGILLGLGFAPSTVAQSHIGGQWVDSSGNLAVTVIDRWGRSCANGTANASYQVAGGSEGFLYPDDCEDNSGRSRFVDTTGVERCVGFSMWRGGASGPSRTRDTTWTIEAAVPGFSCSTVGQVYNIKLHYSDPPTMMR